MNGIINEKTCFEVNSDRKFGYDWILEHSTFIYNNIYNGEEMRPYIYAIKVLAVSENYKIRIISNIFTKLSNRSVVFNNNEILNIFINLNDILENSIEDSILDKFNEILKGVQKICNKYLFIDHGL